LTLTDNPFNLVQMSEIATMETTVSLTKNAVGEIRSLLAKSENAGKNLRLYIEQGGCSGMQYGMVFDEKRDGDLVSESDGVSVLIDPLSAGYLRGTTVDFSDELNAGGFKISNPNAKQSCGCGKSFQA
jgi:iron-sulfur cluster assembly accessory protein